jgi:phosphohistidine phosphatase
MLSADVRLYLVRHAKAAPGNPDELRPLTPEGREQARLLAERLAGERPDAVVTSPLLRARETAEVLARACGLEAVPDERLAPGATSADARLAAAGRGERIVLVGHQPDFGRIAAALTGEEEPPFPTAGMAVIDLP